MRLRLGSFYTRYTKPPRRLYPLAKCSTGAPKAVVLLDSSLGSKIEAVAEVMAKSNSSSRRVEPPESCQSHQEKGKAAQRIVSFAKEVDEKEGKNDDDEDRGTDSGDDYVSHGMHRDIIAEGYDKRSPSRLAPNKHAYFPIDDPVTGTFTASKYSAKAQEYFITVANAFFASVTRASLDDTISAALEGEE